MQNKFANSPLTQMPEWEELKNHHKDIAGKHLRDLFKEDHERFNKFHLMQDELLFDYSKQKITSETLDKLLNLARACNIEQWREKMFTGEKINTSENRAVLHTALRRPENEPLVVNGQDITSLVHNTLYKMKNFTRNIHDGTRSGFSGKKITNIVNIGIGGSDLGPHVVCEALKSFALPDMSIHFISNIDGTHIANVLKNLDPETTLFSISSKTFGTIETLTNAKTAKEWITSYFDDDKAIDDHFVAVTANEELAQEFGIIQKNIFHIWDWSGGRFSLWSAINLPACLLVGFDNFQLMLDGAYSMDQHFINQPLETNIPVIMAMIGIWNQNFCGHKSLAILPYDQNLNILPAYLQQVDMESNGKHIDRNDATVSYETSPTVFGTTGTNAQHAFLQMFHQGTQITPSDFIVSIHRTAFVGDHHDKLLANAIGQAQALMEGLPSDKNTPYYNYFEGNRPSTTIILDRLKPYNLGTLLALYEHKVFVQGVIWNINSFDQWGVTLGKTLAKNIVSALTCDDDKQKMDSSTRGLIDHIKTKYN